MPSAELFKGLTFKQLLLQLAISLIVQVLERALARDRISLAGNDVLEILGEVKSRRQKLLR